MTVRRINPGTGGIVTSGQHFVSGVEEIAQTIKTRLRLFSGEYSRDVTEGTPWFQIILGKGSTNSAREAALRNRILRTKGVEKILEFSTDINPDTRTYSVTAVVRTVYGDTTISQGL